MSTAEQRRNLYWRDPELARKKAKDYRYSHPEIYKKAQRKAQLYSKYGMTCEDFENMWIEQDGKCAICQSNLERGLKTHIDHNHMSGKIRGLLCATCNTGLGWLEKDKWLEKAKEYLRTRS